MSALVVFSHLRWDFVFQRPQQLMSRFALQDKIVFIEEPVFDADSNFVDISSPCPNVQVFRPHTSVTSTGFHKDQMGVLSVLLNNAIQEADMGDYCAWFYTPMALPLLEILKPRAVIYDCMDELSAFSGAPLQLRQLEHALLTVADLVFTGGPSLYESKRSLHPSVHCFPSAVDAQHFATGSNGANAHPELAELGRPRLGFYGVLDERLDVALLGAVAQARPQWNFCMVGPVVKIDSALLPHHPNIHYYGQRPYAELPAFLAGWDVCLMPFALNDATRYISPTKTLEYMAAEKPIVSTPIADVALLYGNLVEIARTPDDFVSACERALDETASQSSLRRHLMRQSIVSLSWDNTVKAMAQLIDMTASRGASGSTKSASMSASVESSLSARVLTSY